MKNSKNKLKIFIFLTIIFFSPLIIFANEDISISETFCRGIFENQEKISSRLKNIEEKRFRFLKAEKEDITLILLNFEEKIDSAIEEAKKDCLDNSKKVKARDNFNIKINSIKNEIQLYIEDIQLNNSLKIEELRENKKNLFEKMSKTFFQKIKIYQNELFSTFK